MYVDADRCVGTCSHWMQNPDVRQLFVYADRRCSLSTVPLEICQPLLDRRDIDVIATVDSIWSYLRDK